MSKRDAIGTEQIAQISVRLGIAAVECAQSGTVIESHIQSQKQGVRAIKRKLK